MSQAAEARERHPRVLVVDDEPMVCEVVTTYLRRDGIDVEVATDGAAALAAIDADSPDLVVLDVMLPQIDGFSVLTEVRRRDLDIPVILLSARAAEDDRIAGLELGAEDYVVKPFSPRELCVRVRKVLDRNGRARPTEAVTYGDLHVDIRARTVRLGDIEVPLTAREFDLLAHLAVNPRRVFTKAQLLEIVWDSREDWQDPATVTVHVGRIRSKLAECGNDHPWIATLRGVGYRFEPVETA